MAYGSCDGGKKGMKRMSSGTHDQNVENLLSERVTRTGYKHRTRMGCGCAEALYLDLHSPPLLIYHVRIDSYSWLSACVPRPHAFSQSLWSPLTSPLNETHVR